MSFQLSPDVDKNKIFLVQLSELEGRLDPAMVLYQRKIKNFKFHTKCFSKLLKNNPQYGANEAGIDRQSLNESRYIRITDIDEYGLLKNGLGKTAKILETQYLLSHNDILVARSGATVGKTYIHKSNKNLYFYAGYMIRFSVDKNEVNPDYVFYYTQLSFFKEWVDAIQRAVAQPNINAEEYKSLKIPIPPKEIQSEIVAKMDTAYDSKKCWEEEAQKLLGGIDDYLLGELGIELPEQTENTLQSRIFIRQLSEVSGGRFDPKYYLLEQKIKCIEGNYCTSYLDKICVIQAGAIIDTNDYLSEGFPLIRINNIFEDKILLHNVKYVSEKIYLKEKKSQLRKGEIIFGLSGSIGRAHIVNNDKKALLNQRIAKIKVLEKVNNVFVQSIINSTIGKLQFQQIGTGGNQININLPDLEKIKIPLPPLAKQTEIANHITAIRKQAQQLQQQAKAELEQAKKEVEVMILGK